MTALWGKYGRLGKTRHDCGLAATAPHPGGLAAKGLRSFDIEPTRHQENK